MVLFTDGGVLHHSSVSKERLGKEPALGPAGLGPQCPLGRVLQQSSLLLTTAWQAGLCCLVKGGLVELRTWLRGAESEQTLAGHSVSM